MLSMLYAIARRPSIRQMGGLYKKGWS